MIFFLREETLNRYWFFFIFDSMRKTNLVEFFISYRSYSQQWYSRNFSLLYHWVSFSILSTLIKIAFQCPWRIFFFLQKFQDCLYSQNRRRKKEMLHISSSKIFPSFLSHNILTFFTDRKQYIEREERYRR